MQLISVALVEDDGIMRERFRRVIDAAASLRFAFGAPNAADILVWLAVNPVDVLLVDLALPDLSGFEVIRRCRKLRPECAVMVVTMFGDEANMLQAFEAGASGYLLKDGTESDLAVHVRSLHSGGSPMSPVIARKLLERWRAGDSGLPRTARSADGATDAAPGFFSPRESQVLDLIARGFTSPEISRQLGVSVTTVQTHVRNIYGKLDVHTKTEAVFEARQLGLLR
jgi:DNA-binding NarL/FixJ family response regulator